MLYSIGPSLWRHGSQVDPDRKSTDAVRMLLTAPSRGIHQQPCTSQAAGLPSAGLILRGGAPGSVSDEPRLTAMCHSPLALI